MPEYSWSNWKDTRTHILGPYENWFGAEQNWVESPAQSSPNLNMQSLSFFNGKMLGVILRRDIMSIKQ